DNRQARQTAASAENRGDGHGWFASRQTSPVAELDRRPGRRYVERLARPFAGWTALPARIRQPALCVRSPQSASQRATERRRGRTVYAAMVSEHRECAARPSRALDSARA